MQHITTEMTHKTRTPKKTPTIRRVFSLLVWSTILPILRYIAQPSNFTYFWENNDALVDEMLFAEPPEYQMKGRVTFHTGYTELINEPACSRCFPWFLDFDLIDVKLCLSPFPLDINNLKMNIASRRCINRMMFRKPGSFFFFSCKNYLLKYLLGNKEKKRSGIEIYTIENYVSAVGFNEH